MRGKQHCTAALCCVFVCVLLCVNARYAATKRSVDGVLLPTFKVTSISHEVSADGFIVRLQLTGDMPQVYHFQITGMSERIPVGNDGTVEIHTNESYVTVMLIHPRGFHTLQLSLWDASVTQQTMPDFQLSLQGGREVTYDSGHDADVNITFKVVDSDGVLTKNMHTYLRALTRSKTKPNAIESIDASQLPFIHNTEERRTMDELEKNVHLNTSSGDGFEGLVQFTVNTVFFCEWCLLSFYGIQQDIPVYRSDHAGPFPPHFLGFQQEGEDPEGEAICSMHSGRPCAAHCLVYGDLPSAPQFVRVDRGGAGQVTSISMSNGGFMGSALLHLDKVGVGDRAVFQCISTSGPEVVSQRITILVVQDAKITNLAVTHPAEGVVEVTCQSEGTPAPTLLFYFNNGTAINDGSSNALQSDMTYADSTSEAVLHISNPAVAREMNSVECRATNVVEGHTFTNTQNVEFF